MSGGRMDVQRTKVTTQLEQLVRSGVLEVLSAADEGISNQLDAYRMHYLKPYSQRHHSTLSNIERQLV